MNRKNPEYPDLIKKTVEGMVEVVKNNYTPFMQESSLDDMCHYELHVLCSFVMRFILKIGEFSSTASGGKVTPQMAFDELSTILQGCITDQLKYENNLPH